MDPTNKISTSEILSPFILPNYALAHGLDTMKKVKLMVGNKKETHYGYIYTFF